MHTSCVATGGCIADSLTTRPVVSTVAGMDDAEARFHALHAWLDREEAHSRHVLGHTKTVTIFSAGLAATFLATAVQADDHSCWDLAAGLALAAAVLITLALIANRRNGVVDGSAFAKSRVDDLHADTMKAAQDNKVQADHAQNLMVLQVFLCLLSGGFAVAPSLIEHLRY